MYVRVLGIDTFLFDPNVMSSFLMGWRTRLYSKYAVRQKQPERFLKTYFLYRATFFFAKIDPMSTTAIATDNIANIATDLFENKFKKQILKLNIHMYIHCT
jgi:hypothetical protein